MDGEEEKGEERVGVGAQTRGQVEGLKLRKEPCERLWI
jgi:hypothetical protein